MYYVYVYIYIYIMCVCIIYIMFISMYVCMYGFCVPRPDGGPLPRW